MDIIERFNQIQHEGKMIRIDPNHPLNLFIGLDNFRNRVFLLNSKKKLKKIKSTKALDILLTETEDMNTLSIKLNNILLQDIFIKFIEDIYEITNVQKKEDELLKILYSRVYLWKSTFSNPNQKLLSKSVIRGLIGELYFLKSYMLNKYGLLESINAWVGPKKYKRDFEPNSIWYEVKTKSTSSNSVKITSVAQLDVEIDGKLAVISMDSTEMIDDKSYNLNSIVQEVFTIYDDLELLDLLKLRLDEMGYHYDPEYDSYNYLITKMDIFEITKDSEILRQKYLPASITEVSYRIDLNYLVKFKE